VQPRYTLTVRSCSDSKVAQKYNMIFILSLACSYCSDLTVEVKRPPSYHAVIQLLPLLSFSSILG